jgi:hypothetical protein
MSSQPWSSATTHVTFYLYKSYTQISTDTQQSEAKLPNNQLQQAIAMATTVSGALLLQGNAANASAAAYCCLQQLPAAEVHFVCNTC